MIVAVVNSKGGVGKTTIAVNLAAALAAPDRRMLLVDLDSQASASTWCGIRRGRFKRSSASVLLHQFPVTQAIRASAVPHLDILPGSFELANADLMLGDVTDRESTLKHALAPLLGRYAFIILDCPPGLSLVTVNALVAADRILVPVTAQPLALDGLSALLGSIDTVRRRLSTHGTLLGIVTTMASHDPKGGDDPRAKLRAQYRDRVFDTEIPLARGLETPPMDGRSVLDYAPRSKAAAAFRQLAKEVLAKLGRRAE